MEQLHKLERLENMAQILQKMSTISAADISWTYCNAAAVFYNAVCILWSPLIPFLRTDFNLWPLY